MSGEWLVFLIFATAAIAGGIMMISAKKVMHMMVALILTFLSVAFIFIQLSAEFVGIVQIMMYAGAISIISIFGIMLTKHNDEEENKSPLSRKIIVGISLLVFGAVMTVAILGLDIPAQVTALHENNVEQIGMALFTDYLIPFEVLSILLLVAFVGAIVLARSNSLSNEPEVDEIQLAVEEESTPSEIEEKGGNE